MDTITKSLERTAEHSTLEAARLIAAKLRQGELPVGAIVTLDASKVEAWPISRFRSAPPPKKLTGRWEVVHVQRRSTDDIFSLHRVGKNGRRLKHSTTNLERLRRSRLEMLLVTAEAPTGNTKRKAKVEKAPDDAPTVREFSVYGPCLTRGRLVRETAKFYVVETREGDNERLSKRGLHIEPCRSCRDHPESHYRDGFWD